MAVTMAMWMCVVGMCVVVSVSGVDANELTAAGAAHHSKNAYVCIHYEGTEKDPEYILGTRVLVKSIKLTETKHDVIILIASNVAQSTRDTFRADGAIVMEVSNIPNPWKTKQVADHEGGGTYQSRFEFTLNKLHLWNLTQYERVVYLDADNVVLSRLDELFNCGHFCAVYMNPCNFHTGLLVVKPDAKMFERMLHTLANESPRSYDGADQGFFTWYFNFERMSGARLFDPFEPRTGPSEEPLMRLPPGYNLNALWFYEKGDWHLYRCHSRFVNLTVPGVSVTFPTPTWLKPWYWWPYLIFDSNWLLWQSFRAQLDESFDGVVIATLVLLVTMILTCLWSMPVAHTSMRIAPKLDRFFNRPFNLLIAKLGPNAFGMLLGLVLVGASIYLPMRFLPVLLPPTVGWFLFAMSGLSLNFIFLVSLSYNTANTRLLGHTQRHSIDVVTIQTAKELIPTVLAMLFMFLVVKLGLYPKAVPFHIGKVLACVVTGALVLGSLLYRYWKLAHDRAASLVPSHRPLDTELPS